MTTGSTSNHHHALHPRDDRETLSALFDGELAADAMRFALKRLDRDVGWRDTCGRWQLIGDALRGEAAVAAPLDFASGVMRTLAAESQAAPAAVPISTQAMQTALSAPGVSRRRWVGGATLAASIAMATVLVVRPFTDSDPPSPGSGAQVAAGVVEPTATQATASLPVQTVAPAPNTPASAGGGSPMDAVAAADARPPAPVPRAARSARTGSQPVPDAIKLPLGETAVVASAAPTMGRQPFHPPTDDIITRPWPRAVLSESAAAGALTVDFGTGAASPSFYPFEPRLPSQDPASAPQVPESQR